MLSLTAHQLEGAILAQVILDTLAAGYRISVDDGEDEHIPPQTLGTSWPSSGPPTAATGCGSPTLPIMANASAGFTSFTTTTATM